MSNPNRTVRTSEGLMFIGDRIARVSDGGAMQTLPLIDGTKYKTTPSSPLYYDKVAHLRSIQVDNPDGFISVRFWRSKSAMNPLNLVAIEAAIATNDVEPPPNPLVAIPQPDLTGEKWIPLTDPDHGLQFDIGLSEVPVQIVQAARRSRWLKVDPIYGSFANTEFEPIFAGT